MRALLRYPYRVAAIVLVLEALCAVAGFGTGIEGLQALARYSGRAGLFGFAVVFLIAPWHAFARSDLAKFALGRRRHLGLAFGWHHLAHLLVLLSYLHASGRPLDPSRAAGGMIGYVFLVAMMLTSNDAAVRRLGATNWKRLHRSGLWYLWIVFLMTYVPRLQGKVPAAGGGRVEFLFCISVVIAMAGARAAAALARRRTRASRRIAG